MANLSCINGDQTPLLSSKSVVIPQRSVSMDSLGESFLTIKPATEKKSLQAIAEALAKELPSTLFEEWTCVATKMGISHSREAFNKSFDGLLCYSVCCRLANETKVALPSKAVKIFWECWTRVDRKSWNEVCRKNFPSMMNADLTELSATLGNEKALAICYFANCMLEEVDFMIGDLPSLFTLDYYLRLPHGKYMK